MVSDDPVIDCILVSNATFYPDNVTLGPPPDFAPSIVMGKSYDLSEESVSEYFEVLIKTHTIISVLLKANDLETIVAALVSSDRGQPAAEGALINRRRELVSRLRKKAEDPATRVEVITYATLLDTAERALVFEDTTRINRAK